MCAPARNSCMAGRKAARASAGAGWRTGSWRRCSPCWNRPRWPRPRRRSPTPNKPTPRRCALSSSTVERARYEADRARRQYDAVEPENRLVARTLERALEAKLAAQRQAEHDLLAAQARRPVQLTDEEPAWLSRAGADVRAIFTAPTTTFRERKQLLRAIVTEVVVTVDSEIRTAAAADHLARRREHRADDGDDQDRRPFPRHRRRHRRPGAAARRPLRRHHHRA